MRRKHIFWILTVCIFVAAVAWILWGNTALEVNTYTIQSQRVPSAFDGFRIAQISDLHNTEMGKNNKKLLDMLQAAEPDVIAITGDMIDSRNTNVAVALDFAKAAMEIAPCYFVTGNHEARVPEYEDLKSGLEALGVVVLSDAAVMLEKDNQAIMLLGVDDPQFHSEGKSPAMDANLQKLLNGTSHYTVLLSHRPELFAIYAKHKVDVVLTGHAHGGQFRLPFVGGVIAPGQGFFPEYDTGLYTKDHTNMLVSRGIGNSIIPVRFNNPPEILVVELKTK